MEIIVEAFRETIHGFSLEKIIGSFILAILSFCFIEFIARMKYKEYLEKQSNEVKGSYFYNKIVGKDVSIEKTLSDYRDEVGKSFIKILVLFLLVLVSIVVLIIVLILFQ